MRVTMHRPVRFLIAVLATVALGACLAHARPTQRAWACSCMGLNDQQAFDWADVAFRGRLIGHASPLTELVTEPAAGLDRSISSMDPATWTFVVLEVYKGHVAAEVDILSPWSGASCGLELPHQGEFYVFASGEPGSSDRPSDLHAGLCGGTRSVVDGPLAVEWVTPMPAATAAPSIAVGSGPSSTPAEVLPASEVGAAAAGTVVRTAAAADAVPAVPTRVATTSRDDGTAVPKGHGTGAIPLAPLGLAFLATLAALAGAVALAVRREK